MWEDYAKSVGKSTNQLTQQEKILAEVNGILEETKFQTGDAIKYANTFAGKTAQLSATFIQLKNAIGQVIMPIASLFIPIIQKAMNAMISFFNVVKQVMSALGFDMSGGLSKTSTAYESLGENALASANDIVSASKKAKKANSIMNYDELNILKSSNSNDSSNGSNDGGVSSSVSGSSPTISDMIGQDTEDVISPKAQKIADNISKAWKTVKNVFKTGGAFVKKHWNTLVAVVVSGVVAITTALLGIKIAQFISGISSMMSAISSAGGLFSALAGIIGGVSAPILLVVGALALLAGGFTYLYMTSQPFKDTVNEIVNAFVISLKPALEFITTTVIPDLINGFNSFVTIMQPVADFVQGTLTDAWEQVLKPAIMYITDTVLPALISTFENLWNNILVPFGDFIGSILEPTIKILTEAFEILWKNILLPICDFIGSVLSKAFESVAEIFNKTVIPIINKGIEVFSWLWKSVLEPIVNFLWSTLKPGFEIVTKAIGDVFEGLKTVFSGVLDFVTGIFTLNWSKAWEGIKQIFSGIWDTLGAVISGPLNLILSGVESFINKIIDGFNFLKKSLNKISFDVPDWVPIIGGKKWGFDLQMSEHVSLPRLKDGGWVEPNKPRPVIVGDNKREGEIISPESKIYEQTFKAAMDANSRTNGTSRIEITLIHKYPDGRYMIQEINDTQIKDGKITLLT